MKSNQRTTIYAKATPSTPHDGSWYTIKAQTGADGKTTGIEILIYDEIGTWGLRAIDFIHDLKAMDDGVSPVTVAINSIGGEVFDGIAIHNALKRLGDRTTARIDGVAASIASVIAVGCHTVIMPENTMMMIHNPWTIAWGEADDLRATADMMDKVRSQLVSIYLGKAPAIDQTDLIKMLDDTTWLTAAEAVALGLADVISETVSLQASATRHEVLARLKNVPVALLTASEPHVPDKEATAPPESPQAAIARSAARISQARIAANLPDLAEELIMSTKLDDEADVTAMAARIKEVQALCVTVRLPELAADYIKAGLTAQTVRARLFDRLVQGQADIDNKQPPENAPPASKAKTPDASSIYAGRKTGTRKTNPIKE